MLEAPFPLTCTDARRRVIHLPRPPRRIVSLVPSQTELLADLGLDEAVVGLTRFCVHPAGWKQTRHIVGGTKQVNRKRVRALAPDLILANLEENTREDVEALDAAAPVYVTDVGNVAEALEMIRTVGRLTDRSVEAEMLAGRIEAAFAALAAASPIRCAYLIWRAPYMTVGGDTFIHDVLHRAGLQNVFAGQTRYPVVTPEALAAARPDVVLLSSEPYPFSAEHIDELRPHLPGIRLHLVDGERLSWYGSRLLQTPSYLNALRRQIG